MMDKGEETVGLSGDGVSKEPVVKFVTFRELRQAAAKARGGVGKRMPDLSPVMESRRQRYRHGLSDPPATELNVLTERAVKKFQSLTELAVAKLNGKDELTPMQAMWVQEATRCERDIQETTSSLRKDMKVPVRLRMNAHVLKAMRMRDGYLVQLGLLVGAKVDPLAGDDDD